MHSWSRCSHQSQMRRLFVPPQTPSCHRLPRPSHRLGIIKKKVEPLSKSWCFLGFLARRAIYICLSPRVTTAQKGKPRECAASTPPHPDASISGRSSVATGRVRRMGRVRDLGTLGRSLACLTADMIAPIFLPVNNHNTAAAA